MTVVGGGTSSAGLIARVKNILLTPKTEWEVIDAEPTTIKDLYIGYAVILAAIPALSSFIGGQLFGFGAMGIHFKPPLIGSLVTAIVTYALSLVGVGLLGLVINALAPSFDGVKDQVKAFKVAIYSMTAAWVAGILGLVPMIAMLGVLAGLYGLYLLYLGLPRLMKAPEEKTLGYTIVTIIVAIVLNLVVGMVAAAVTAPLMLSSSVFGANSAAGGTLSLPGVGSVDVGKMEKAAKEMESAAKQMQAASGTVAAGGTPAGVVAPDVLQTLLPAALPNGFARTEVSSMAANVGGLGGTHAEGVYNKGDARISLEVTDIGAAGAMMGAVRVNSNKQTADGYEKIGQVNGRMTTEEYNRSSNSGKYGVLVASRYMVEADGNGVTIEDLKAAVGAVPLSRLEALSKG